MSPPDRRGWNLCRKKPQLSGVHPLFLVAAVECAAFCRPSTIRDVCQAIFRTDENPLWARTFLHCNVGNGAGPTELGEAIIGSAFLEGTARRIRRRQCRSSSAPRRFPT